MAHVVRTFTGYALSSAALMGAIAVNAYWKNQQQYYPSAVYLVNSKLGAIALANMAIVCALFLAKLLFVCFLGRLKDRELERLTDTLPIIVMDTLLVMTIFHEEFNAALGAQFGWVLLLKAFHMVVEERVSFIEQNEAQSRWQYTRLFSLVWILGILDLICAQYYLSYIYEHGPSIRALFALEHTLLCVRIATISTQFMLSVVNMRMGGAWHAKGWYVLVAECASAAIRFLVHVTFFIGILKYYGLPLHMVRQMLATYGALQRARVKLAQYTRIQAIMNERFVDATLEELEDEQCIICRDDAPMQEGKKLPCGHIFHFECLNRWLQEGQFCPLCMRSVFTGEPVSPNGDAPPENPAAVPDGNPAPPPEADAGPPPAAAPQDPNPAGLLRPTPPPLETNSNRPQPAVGNSSSTSSATEAGATQTVKWNHASATEVTEKEELEAALAASRLPWKPASTVSDSSAAAPREIALPSRRENCAQAVSPSSPGTGQVMVDARLLVEIESQLSSLSALFGRLRQSVEAENQRLAQAKQTENKNGFLKDKVSASTDQTSLTTGALEGNSDPNMDFANGLSSVVTTTPPPSAESLDTNQEQSSFSLNINASSPPKSASDAR